MFVYTGPLKYTPGKQWIAAGRLPQGQRDIPLPRKQWVTSVDGVKASVH